jgi:hypothetical protein
MLTFFFDLFDKTYILVDKSHYPEMQQLQSLHVILRTTMNNIDMQASTLTFFLTCPFGQLTKKSTCPTQYFSCSNFFNFFL